MLIPKERFYELGGLNEDLFWMEDIDFCKRLRLFSYGVYHSQNTKIIHFAGKSSIKNYKIAISNQLLSKLKFFKIYHSNLKTQFLKILIIAMCLFKIILFLILYVLKIENRAKLKAYLKTLRLIFMN